jgi:acyl-coenzyme A synthetase/AMP-(fatty) acid ligase/thioesterase domain-containing protein
MATAVQEPGSMRRPVGSLGLRNLSDGVVGRFHQVVHAQPDARAVTDADREVTFAQVAAEAGQLLAGLRAALGDLPAAPADSAVAGDPEPIALLHGHNASAVSALLAIVASGHPVLVLDPRTPALRLKTMLDRVAIRVCVADADLAATAVELVPHVVQVAPVTGEPLSVDQALPLAEPLWTDPPAPRSIAVIALTSGTTGRPKVVMNDHEMLVRDAWVNSYATACYTADDVIAHTLPMAFHAGLMATLGGLMVGCTMRLYDVRGSGIGGLAAWIDEVGATVMHASPAILRAFVGTKPLAAQLTRLRSVTIAGESAYGRDLETFRVLLPPGCTIRNRYGSSETGLIAEFAISATESLPEGVLPVGFGVGDTVLSLVDEDGQPVAEGESGIVTVTALKTASGYWHDPDTTSASFVPNADGTSSYRTSDVGRMNEDGRLTLLGRRDHSVKVRGYLVEPGEVDAALFALGDVREAMVVGRPRPGDGQMRLVAYVVSTAERPSAVSIRAALHNQLPGYMVPETVVFLDALPRTDRGKLDRSALPEPPAVVPGRGVEKLSEWESIVAGVWERVLALEMVGRDDDFFELGGDSLAAEQLMSALVQELGVADTDARTTLLAEAPTLGEFSKRLARSSDGGHQTLIPLQTGGTRPPLFLVAGAGGLGVGLMPLAKHLGADQPTYALQAYGLERRGLPDWSVQATARRHVRSVRSVQPHGPYHLGGHSFGGLVALEMAHQLRASGEDVDLLVVLDSFPPEPSLHPKPDPGRSVKRRLRDGAGLLATGIVATPGLGQYWRFHRQSMLLSRLYRCPRWEGRTLLVVADSPEREQRASWGPHLSGEWEQLDVGGDHLSMMREPWAGQIGEAVSRMLGIAFRARAGEQVSH